VKTIDGKLEVARKLQDEESVSVEGFANELLMKHAAKVANSTDDFFQKQSLHFVTQYFPTKGDAFKSKKFPGKNCMFFEYVSGNTLRDFSETTPLNMSERGPIIVAQAASALSVMHKAGIVHRDINPSNIMLTDRGVIKIIDLGIAYTGNFTQVNLFNSYSSPIEVYEAARSCSRMGNWERLPQMLHECTVPAYDVYGFGMNLLLLLFGSKVAAKISATLSETKHNDYEGNIAMREQIIKDAFLYAEEFNEKLPAGKRYTQEGCKFIADAVRACMDSNPHERPTMAQIAEIFELFSAGVTDFGTARKIAESDRPSCACAADQPIGDAKSSPLASATTQQRPDSSTRHALPTVLLGSMHLRA
jgi:serine/threonine protein kinase